MKNKCLLIFVCVLLLSCMMVFVACSPGDENKGEKFYALPLNSNAVAAESSTNPKVLDSHTDGKKNYYLIDVGYIEDLFISTIAMVDYTGVPIDFTKEISTASSITTTLTESISSSITISDAQSHTSGLSLGWKNKFPLAGEFSVKAQYEWTGSWTNSETTEKSTSKTVESSSKYAETKTVNFSFGKNTDPVGKYRYAIYGVCDVYFIVTTTRDNKEILKWETNVCARPNKYFVRSEYSENGKFENKPINEINFSDDFYRNLIIPNDNLSQQGDTLNYNGGHGTIESPYKVSTITHFINMIELKIGCFILENDIDLGDWSVYGIKSWAKNTKDAPNSFSGTFDGNNKTIKYKIRIGGTTLISWAFGLFPATNNATIKKLNVIADLSTYDPQNRNQKWHISNNDRAEDVMCGGIVGYARDSIITDCRVSGDVKYNSDGGRGDTCVGGVVGFGKSSTILNCASSATVYARGYILNVAGCIGVVYESTYYDLQFNGNVSGNNDWWAGKFLKDALVAKTNSDVLKNN